MLKHELGEKHETVSGTCPTCIKAMAGCVTCKNSRNKP
jgi:hypothetical protein